MSESLLFSGIAGEAEQPQDVIDAPQAQQVQPTIEQTSTVQDFIPGQPIVVEQTETHTETHTKKFIVNGTQDGRIIGALLNSAPSPENVQPPKQLEAAQAPSGETTVLTADAPMPKVNLASEMRRHKQKRQAKSRNKQVVNNQPEEKKAVSPVLNAASTQEKISKHPVLTKAAIGAAGFYLAFSVTQAHFQDDIDWTEAALNPQFDSPMTTMAIDMINPLGDD